MIKLTCCIYVAPDGKVYTNFDSKIETRRKKLELLGIDPSMTCYEYSDIPMILDKSDRVLVVHGLLRSDKYSFGFEEVLNRLGNVSNIEKLVFTNTDGSLSWSIKSPSFQLDIEPHHFDRIELRYENSEDNEEARLLKLHLWSWHRLYNISNREEVWDSMTKKYNDMVKNGGDLGFAKIDQLKRINILTGYITFPVMYIMDPELDPHYFRENVNKYYFLEFKTSVKARNKALKSLFENTNYRVSPIYTDYRSCVIMLDRDEKLKTKTYNILSRHGVQNIDRHITAVHNLTQSVNRFI